MGGHIFKRHNKTLLLWGGKFWTSGFYANTVDQYANEEVIRAFVKNQGTEKEYKKLHTNKLTLF